MFKACDGLWVWLDPGEIEIKVLLHALNIRDCFQMQARRIDSENGH